MKKFIVEMWHAGWLYTWEGVILKGKSGKEATKIQKFLLNVIVNKVCTEIADFLFCQYSPLYRGNPPMKFGDNIKEYTLWSGKRHGLYARRFGMADVNIRKYRNSVYINLGFWQIQFSWTPAELQE